MIGNFFFFFLPIDFLKKKKIDFKFIFLNKYNKVNNYYTEKQHNHTTMQKKMQEPRSNIRYMAPPAKTDWTENVENISLDIFLDTMVKRPFTCINKDNNNELINEHMWVKITGIEDNVLKGILQNHPDNLTPLKFGDEVMVDVKTIVRVMVI